MKKTILKSLFTICFGFALCLTIVGFSSNKVLAATSKISYITTCVGENETSIGINYHCTTPNSVVKYSTSSTFPADSTFTAAPTETLWGKAVDSSDAKTGFADRYVCKVNLTNLEENTQYFYKIVAEDAVSGVYQFRTYSASNTTTNILFASDVHSASGSYAPTRPNNMINAVNNTYYNKINLLVMTGDQIDRGGYEEHWQNYYNSMTCFKNLIQATIPGNHEYYHTSGGAYVSPEFYNQFYNNPQNGYEERLNSSYYFKYGNVLFIMLDIVDKKYVSEAKEWFAEVCENNPSQWIIVGSHPNAITGGSYKTDASFVKTNFGPLYEKYQVDLVIGGHEHVYMRKDLIYKNEKDADLGVTYYTTPSAQHKLYSVVGETDLDEYYNVNYKVNTISISKDSLTVKLFNESGKEEGFEFTLQPKRSNKITTQKDSTLLNALNITYDKETMDAEITWNKTFYQNVKNVIVERINGEYVKEYSTFVSAESVKKIYVGPLYTDQNYEFKVKLEKWDGTILEKDFEITNVVPYNLNLELDGGSIENPENWKTYYSGKSTKLPTPTKEGYLFDGWYLDAEFSTDKIAGIAPTLTGELTIYAKWIRVYTITYNVGIGTMPQGAPNTYMGGEKFTLEEPTHESKRFIGWYDNPNFEGSQVRRITETTTGDLVLYAKWEGDTTSQPATGCAIGGTIMFVQLFSAVSVLGLAFRKRK